MTTSLSCMSGWLAGWLGLGLAMAGTETGNAYYWPDWLNSTCNVKVILKTNVAPKTRTANFDNKKNLLKLKIKLQNK